ncbi:MAG: GNAT family N-acetyltransferase [bacterium]
MPSPGCCSLEGGFAHTTPRPPVPGRPRRPFIAALPLAGLVSRGEARGRAAHGLAPQGGGRPLGSGRAGGPGGAGGAARGGPRRSARSAGGPGGGQARWRRPRTGCRRSRALLAEQYWHVGSDPAAIVAAHRGSGSLGAGHDPGGRAAGALRGPSATALARPGSWTFALVPGARGRGLGRALMGLVLAHPALRGVARVFLGTRDAQAFYGPLGFAPHAPHGTTVMVRTA